MDLTPGPEVYRACAEASWEAPGTQKLWRDYQRDTYVELMLARPDWRTMVDEAYRAGREDAARDVERVAGSTRESLVGTPPEYVREAAWLRTRAEAFERAAVIARGSKQPRTPQRSEAQATEDGRQ